MSIRQTKVRRNVVLAVALTLAVWALFGFADLHNIPDDGMRYDARGVIGLIQAGGVAERAGLRVGDRVTSIDGVSISDTEVLRRRPRAAIGETRQFVIERTDEASGATIREDHDVTYGSLLAAQPIRLIGGALLGVVFLICGALAYLRAPSTQSLIFAGVSLCFAVLFLPYPYLPAPGLGLVVSAASVFAGFAVFACLLHLMLAFPEPRSILGRRGVVAGLYLLPLLIGALGAFETARGAQLGPVLTLLGTIVLVIYLLVAIVVLSHRYATTTRERRAASGLRLVVWGIIVGFGPLTVSAIMGLLAPSVSLPGSAFYYLCLVAIPLSFTVALSRLPAGATAVIAVPTADH